MAVQAVANIVRTSLGPVGLDKMLVDDIGDVTITNDGATILKLLEVEHPAAKVRDRDRKTRVRETSAASVSFLLRSPNFWQNDETNAPSPTRLPPLPSVRKRTTRVSRPLRLSRLSRATRELTARTSLPASRRTFCITNPQILVELADLQDREVGDGTTSVVILAGELLRRANDLVRNKIHPTSIIGGYRLAMRESVKFLESTLATDIAALGTETILNCAKTSMSSKIVGADADFFGKMVVDAVMAVKTYNDYGDPRYPIKSINVLKAHGKSVKESRVINGYALNLGRAAQGMVKSVKNAKVACIDFNLQKTKMQMGV